jgi:hypothetical protein
MVSRKNLPKRRSPPTAKPAIAAWTDVLKRLRQTLETNASEAIALEVGFLGAFA